MSEITIQNIDNEFDNFCRENKCETCVYASCGDCKTVFVNDRYEVEIKKKDPFDTVKKESLKIGEEYEAFCEKHDSCVDCPLDCRCCYTMYIIAKERGIL